jgi:acetyl esterase/lipase
MTQEQRAAVDALLRQPTKKPATVAEAREQFVAQITRPIPEDVRVGERTLGGRPALTLEPAGSTPEGGVLLFLHGGGYVVGTHAALAAGLAGRAGLRAVLPDYRLAPEHRHPAAVDDALAAYRELIAEVGTADRVVLAGDSAGGGLALATVSAARTAGLAAPAAVVVFSPWVDLTGSGESMRTRDGVDPIFAPADIEEYAVQYLGEGDRRTPSASPLFGDLHGLPPLLIQVGGNELLLDDAVRLAARAAADDVDVTLRVWPGVPHVFQHFAGLLDEAGEALEEAGAFLRRYLPAG